MLKCPYCPSCDYDVGITYHQCYSNKCGKCRLYIEYSFDTIRSWGIKSTNGHLIVSSNVNKITDIYINNVNKIIIEGYFELPATLNHIDVLVENLIKLAIYK